MTTATPLVSIIVPIYKVEEYLRQCIDTILSQSYTNIEVILVDDGSPDQCPSICDEYQQQDSRIKVIHKENGGLSDARNAGINIATGDWICFVDSDDYIHGNYIENLLNSVLENECEIGVCDYLEFKTNEDLQEMVHSDLNVKLEKNEALYRLLSLGGTKYIVAWNKIYKRDLFSDIRYPKGFLFEDELTTYKLIFKAKNIAVNSDKLYFYRQRANSIIASSKQKDRIHVLRKAYSEMTQLFSFNDMSKKIIALLCYKIFYTFVNEYKIDKEIDKNAYLQARKNVFLQLKYLTPNQIFRYFVWAIILGCRIK